MWRVPEPGGAWGWHGMLDILRRYCSSASCSPVTTRGERKMTKRKDDKRWWRRNNSEERGEGKVKIREGVEEEEETRKGGRRYT